MVDDSNVDVDRMSDSWTGFTKFTLLCEKTSPQKICGPGGGLHYFQATTRHVTSSSKKGKAFWAVEKPKLDNARKLRGIYFIDADDGGFRETFQKHARKKLEFSNGDGYAL